MAEWFRKIIFSKSKTFLAFCFCFIAGSGLGSLVSQRSFATLRMTEVAFYLYLSLFFLTAAIILFWSKFRIRFIIFCVLFLVFGLWRYAMTLPDCNNSSALCFYNGRSVSFVGVVSDEPQQKIDGVNYTISVLSVSQGSFGVNPLRMTSEVSGKVLVKNRLYPVFNYGDKLSISCKLMAPENPPGSVFHYDKYLARFGIWSACGYPNIKKISSGGGNPLLAVILNFKSFLNNRVNDLWAEPEGSLMSGLLYGARSSLPTYLVDDFSRTGISHIVAVSGFNITIIAMVLMNLLIYFGFFRQRAFYVIVGVTVLFVIFTGLTASAIRAAVMGIAVLTARQVGRGTRVANVLVLTVALMQLFNPYLLIWDVGFQLSFLALIGLVYISPILTVILSGAKDPLRYKNKRDSSALPQNDIAWIKIIREPLAQTLSAIIATLPLMLYQFGTLSLVAPLVNILILWIVPWLMLAGTVSIGVSLIFFPLGKLFAFITHFGLSYVIMVVQFFGEQSWSSASVQIPLWLMFLMYGVLIFVFYEKNKSV